MHVAWIVIGIALLAFTLLDTFLAVLNYNEAGIFANRLVRWEWIAIRGFTRRIPRRWHPIVLRQVTGVLIVTTLLCWIVGLVLGFTFIYLGLIGFGLFEISDGVTPDFVGAFYLSVGQFSTSGADNISPGGGWVNLVPVAEALLSVVMLSFFIAFLSNIYSVIQNLRSLCADFFQVGAGVGSPIEALRPFFPAGQPRGLDLHLTFMVNDFNLYCDSLRQDHAAYHFQSGEDQFSLPYALYMSSGVIGALQWGLPRGHAATQSPEIVRLIEAFNNFRDRRYQMMGWRALIAPAPLSRERFEKEWEAYLAHRLGTRLDPWAGRFFAVNDAMGELARSNVITEGDDAYGRYVEWLAFAYPAQQFVTDVGGDLDFQPIYHEDSALLALAPTPAQTGAHGGYRLRGQRGIGTWLRRRQIFLDPGFVRLRSALRTVVVVVVAVVLAVGAANTFAFSSTTAGALAGLVVMFASAPSRSAMSAMRRWGLIGLVPVAVGITFGVLLPRESGWTILGLAVVAALAVWVGRFGSVAASFGRLFFIATFFAAVLTVEPSEYLAAFIAAAIGVVCSWAASFLPPRSSDAQLRGISRAFAARTSMLLDAAIDVVSAGTDRTLGKRLRANSLALHDTGSHLAILLDPGAPPTGLSRLRTQLLRLRVFDAELAVHALLRGLPSTTDYAVTIDVRALLVGELMALQHHIQALGREEQSAPYEVRADLRLEWTENARRAFVSIGEMAAAFEQLDATQRAEEEILAGAVGPEDHVKLAENERHFARDATEIALTDRRAVQSGLSVGLALLFGGFVSVGAQYWAALPAYQSLSAADGFAWTRNLLRVVSTVAGAALAFGLMLWTDHNTVVALAVLVVSVFLTAFLRVVASSWTVFWQTVVLATMYDVVSSLDAEAVNLRIAETAIGAVIALVVSAIVLPTRTRTRIRKRMTEAVTAAMSATHSAFERFADPSSINSSTIAVLDSETTGLLHDIHVVTRNMRDGSGALARGGIEAQLISLWVLLYYVRRLVGTHVTESTQAITPTEWQRIDAFSRDNFQAALAVLADRMPSRVHDVRKAIFPTAGSVRSAERDLLVDIMRINEVLLAYMDDVSPGSSEI